MQPLVTVVEKLYLFITPLKLEFLLTLLMLNTKVKKIPCTLIKHFKIVSLLSPLFMLFSVLFLWVFEYIVLKCYL